MGGNVWEWCRDRLGATGENATFRVWRGGSCGVNNEIDALSSYRHGGAIAFSSITPASGALSKCRLTIDAGTNLGAAVPGVLAA